MSKPITKQTSEDYVKSGGSLCPFCKSSDIEGYSGFDADGSTIWANIICNTCQEEWREYYNLAGCENI